MIFKAMETNAIPSNVGFDDRYRTRASIRTMNKLDAMNEAAGLSLGTDKIAYSYLVDGGWKCTPNLLVAQTSTKYFEFNGQSGTLYVADINAYNQMLENDNLRCSFCDKLGEHQDDGEGCVMVICTNGKCEYSDV